MGQPSTQASNAIIYLTYGAFLYDIIDVDDATLTVLELVCHPMAGTLLTSIAILESSEPALRGN